jgi:hypothetical protein
MYCFALPATALQNDFLKLCLEADPVVRRF